MRLEFTIRVESEGDGWWVADCKCGEQTFSGPKAQSPWGAVNTLRIYMENVHISKILLDPVERYQPKRRPEA